jgi:putative ABC transport system ATP-binding protein
VGAGTVLSPSPGKSPRRLNTVPDEGSLIKLRGVDRAYGSGDLRVDALRGVDLDVTRGEFIVVLGPSGSGKTTLLNLIGGIDRPSAGTVAIAGRDLTGMSEKELTGFRREQVGFIFQFFNLVPSLTASENVALAGDLVADPRDIGEVLEEVGLGDRAGHYPDQLSGGEQQRVAIARALVKNPALLLCDEPTGELDFETGRTVLGTMRQVNRDEGRTLLLVTHNHAIAEIGDRVLRLSGGRIVEDRGVPEPKPPEELRW